MSLATKYSPQEVEDKWYQHWMEQGFFHSEPDDRESYTIVIPPPNVTGVLHMGHMLNNTIQDVLIRRARMKGFNACWVPGTDHASIATEAKVVNMLKEKGINKYDIGREEFLKHAWEWKEKHGGIILEQLKKLGASCDWDRTRFTMEDSLSEAVIDTFVDLHKKGMIYRGYRIVNWDPKALTAVSDEEVIHKEVASKLYYVKYEVAEMPGEYLTIATTRPETIMGDTAICVHPEDERYKHLKGKHAIVPLVNRKVPIIYDDYIDLEFGTGALKVTPAHDVNDYEIGQRHNLAIIDTLNADGTLSEKAEVLVGEDRFAARKKIPALLEEAGSLVKVEDYTNKVGYSERTNEVIEPRLSLQWFLDMSKLSEPALRSVNEGDVKLIPHKFINTYKHWMENVRDWCISRQLWWGHQIPAFYYGTEKDDYVVAASAEEALAKAKEVTGNTGLLLSDLKQDEDVLDTWFSSWLWPISVFDGFSEKGQKELDYYYPTKVLVTAPEILFFWVARMIMVGYEYKDKKPFDDVYLTGIVRDKQGRKMSKSLGNSPDPFELIKKYGADGVRVGMLLASPAGNDLLFDEKLCEQGRNFSNKIWNAYRLMSSWETSDKETPAENLQAISWMKNRLQQSLAQLEDHYEKYRMSDALMEAYKLVWDDFCSWYLELVKPAYQQPIDVHTLTETNKIFTDLLKVLHPFMPFLTEELWHQIQNRDSKDCLIVAEMPQLSGFDEELLIEFNAVKTIVSEVRNLRAKQQLSPKESLLIQSLKVDKIPQKESISKLANISAFEGIENRPEMANAFMVNNIEFFIPLTESFDAEAEVKKLEEELQYTKGFLKGVEKKLSNERFVNNAPEKVVEIERKKKADAEQKIASIAQQLSSLK